MKIVVIGAGITGISAAYFLAERGHKVTVIEREPASAMQTSFANGGQLSYSHAEPWANPAVLPKALKWLFKDDAPLLFRPGKLDWHTVSWLMRFLSQCTPKRACDNTEVTLRLGLYSRSILNDLVERTKVEFHYRHKGILHLFRSKAALDACVRQADYQVKLGAPYEYKTPEQIVALEPALKHVADQLAGAIYYAQDESGDIHLFTRELAELGEASGNVTCQYSTTLNRLRTEGNRIVAAETDKGDVTGDMYVMCAGSYSYIYLKQLGINVPMYPMKGYSISIPVGEENAGAPVVSLTDQAEKIVYSRLGPILRAAGTAEFSGFNDKVVPKRIEMLKRAAKRWFPSCAGAVDECTEWACLRPQLPDGAALLGKTKYDNLVLNTGHGSLGWTLGPGSAKITADIIDGITPDISLAGLTLDRFK